MLKSLEIWMKRNDPPKSTIDYRVRKSGAMTNEELIRALTWTRDSSLIRALEEVRARLEDEIMETAFHANHEGRLAALSRIEGVNEFFKNIMIFRDASEQKREEPT
jgi:DNA-binding FadR family transcriptional regulator